ncbi:hypothetical protein QO790_003144 [Salmonella enterica]|nr:hypothetical protein [Salmonella enterica]
MSIKYYIGDINMCNGIIYIDYGNYMTNPMLNPLAAYITFKNADNLNDYDGVPVTVFASHDGELIDDAETEKMLKSWDERVASAVSKLIGKYDNVKVYQCSYYKNRAVLPALMDYIVNMIPDSKRGNVQFPFHAAKWNFIVKNAA